MKNLEIIYENFIKILSLFYVFFIFILSVLPLKNTSFEVILNGISIPSLKPELTIS